MNRARLGACALVALLGAGYAFAQGALRFGPGCRSWYPVSMCNAAPLFEFAPASGAGMGAECACAAVTGSKGETVTHTRASSATCQSSSNTITECLTDLPAVRSLAGLKMLQVEPAATNLTVRSNALEHASWSYVFSGAATPSFSAVTTTGPDGATVAGKFTFPAATAAQYTTRGIGGAGCAQNTTCTMSCWVKGASSSGTIDICRFGSATGSCGACAYTTSWGRCSHTVTWGATGDTFSNVAIGNGPLFNGGTERAESTVYVSDCQAETGSTATSYIPTVAASATRALTNVSVARPAGWTDTVGCMGATTNVQFVTSGARLFATSAGSLSLNSNTAIRATDGTNTPSSTVSALAGRTVRSYAYWAGATLDLTADSVAATQTPYDGTITGDTVYLGCSATTDTLNGLIGAVKLDNKPEGCR